MPSAWPVAGEFHPSSGPARALALLRFRHARVGDFSNMFWRDEIQTAEDEVLKRKQAKREMFLSDGHQHELVRFWFHLLANR